MSNDASWAERPLGDHILAESPRWDQRSFELIWVDVFGGLLCRATLAHESGVWTADGRWPVGVPATAVAPFTNPAQGWMLATGRELVRVSREGATAAGSCASCSRRWWSVRRWTRSGSPGSGCMPGCGCADMPRASGSRRSPASTSPCGTPGAARSTSPCMPYWAAHSVTVSRSTPRGFRRAPPRPAPPVKQSCNEAEELRDKGWTAVKVAIGVDTDGDLASVTTVRDLFGPDAVVLADAAGAYDVRRALAVGRALADLGVGFFEMPVPPEQVDDYACLTARLDVPLALDSLATRYQALELLRADALHVLQADVCRAGGITETMRIAALADAFSAVATPHVSIGSAIHFAASLQCAAAIPNHQVMEHWIGDNPLATSVAPDLDEPSEGVRRVGHRPGLGITVDEAAVRRLAGQP